MSTKNGPKNKGTTSKGKTTAKSAKRVAKAAPAPEAVVEETARDAVADDAAGTAADAPAGDDNPIDADTSVENAAATMEAAPKRKRDMSLAELQSEYLAVVGRPTSSTNRGYIYWKMAQARKGRITVGAIERRPARDKADQQVLPLTLLRETTRLLDAAVAASGAKSRSAFIRAALIEKLRTIGSPDSIAAADALAGEDA